MLAFQATAIPAAAAGAEPATSTGTGTMIGAILIAGVIGLVVVRTLAARSARTTGEISSEDILSKLTMPPPGMPEPEFKTGSPGLPPQAPPDTPLGRLQAKAAAGRGA